MGSLTTLLTLAGLGGQGPRASFIRQDAQGPPWPLLARAWVGCAFLGDVRCGEESCYCLERAESSFLARWLRSSDLGQGFTCPCCPRVPASAPARGAQARGRPRAPRMGGSSSSQGAQQPVSCPSVHTISRVLPVPGGKGRGKYLFSILLGAGLLFPGLEPLQSALERCSERTPNTQWMRCFGFCV